jgi:hypothetical protein
MYSFFTLICFQKILPELCFKSHNHVLIFYLSEFTSLGIPLKNQQHYPLQRIRSFRTLQSAVVEKLPFFALCLVSSLVALSAQKAAGAMIQLTDAPLATRAVVSIKALMMYLWKMAMPFDLAPLPLPALHRSAVVRIPHSNRDYTSSTI